MSFMVQAHFLLLCVLIELLNMLCVLIELLNIILLYFFQNISLHNLDTLKMLSIDCSINSQPTKLLITDSCVVLPSSTIPFSSIKSVHTKNSPSFLLKLNSNFILLFSSPHLRDMAKNIILDKIKTLESISKNINESDLDYKRILKNIRGIVKNPEALLKKKPLTHIHLQRSPFSPESFFSCISQPLIDVFVKMNCSIEQFYNLLVSSFFYDIKNKKNTLDRLLAETLRSGNEVSLDYATRINSLSLLDLTEATSLSSDIRPTLPKQVTFQPSVYCEDEIKECLAPVEFKIYPLKADFSVINDETLPVIPFDPADFEAARDLCKIVYADGSNLEIEKFSDTLINLVEGKYGKEAVGLVERLIPTYYKKKG